MTGQFLTAGQTLKLPDGTKFQIGPNAVRFDAFNKEWLRHIAGPLRHQPIALEPYWLKVATDVLDTLDEDGYRLYRELFIEIARKNFKSGFLSCLSAYFLVEESRDAPGGQVLAAATAKEQGRIVFALASNFLKRSPLEEYLDFYKDAIVNPETDTTYRVISSDAKVNYGLDPIFISFDEVHAFEDDDRIYEALKTASIARAQAMLGGITTAGTDEDTLAGRLRQKAQRNDKAIKAKKKPPAPRFYSQLYEADPKKLEKAKTSMQVGEIFKAANPASWIKVKRLAEEYDEVKDSPRELAMFKRQHGNIWTGAVESLFADDVWPKLYGKVTLKPKDAVVATLDLGLTRDSTGLVIAGYQDDGKIHMKATSWGVYNDARKAAPKVHHILKGHHKVPMEEIESAVYEADSEYKLLELAVDPARMERSVQLIESRGIKVMEFHQTDARMIPATETFIEAVHAGRIVVEDDPIFAAQIAAAVARMTNRGPRLDKKPAKDLMDLAVCAAMAVYRLHLIGRRPVPTIYMPTDAELFSDDDEDD
jgi:phage terminase large subunit-like protein